jgi:hypothetical protein
MSKNKHTNSLINASSPYLLQHAHNPVNWQEWSDAILDQAKLEDKLILISIGYSACHWCHVMEHECFEKEDTAAIMNERFICVKIDREERPDIDQVYMDAIQLLTGRGGWPLNMFTLPDGRPLHGGTYFPKQEWERVLISLSNFYQEKKTEALEFATNLTNGVRKMDQFIPENLEDSLFTAIIGLLNKWKLQFDLQWGAYNWSPKFPMPNQWELFMGIHFLTKDPVFKEASYTTLTKMFEGGIFDHLAGGFARYSTDSFWKVPHFEKMLYDNAQLMGTYAMAAKYFKEPLFEKVAASIHTFISNDLKSPDAHYYSALDADTEGVEGKFYVWSQQEISEVLQEDTALFCAYFSVEPNGNWEGENILYRTTSIKMLVENFQKTETEIETQIANNKKTLLLRRGLRTKPGLDDKIICSWNALMIKGYAQAYLYLQKEEYLQEAIIGIDCLLDWCLEGKQVFRIFKNGKKSINGFAEDYACLIDALIHVFEASSIQKYLLIAHELIDECLKQFYDHESGLFYFSSTEQKVLVTRKIDVNDDVIPSANSILAFCLYRLSYYFNRPDLEAKQERMLQAIAPKMKKFPNGFSNWMQLIALKEKGFTQIIICGKEAQNWKDQLQKGFSLNTIFIEITEQTEIPLFKEKAKIVDVTTAYICKDKTCSLPIYSAEETITLLAV